MGKKYIIELEREETAYKTVNSNGTPLIQLLAPTPYTEPDLERVRKEGYKEGREAGIKDGKCEAWEAARKIIHMPEGDLLNVFTECYSAVCTALQVILKHDAPEAIEKLKAYEQDRETIQVGDEVINRDKKAVVTEITDRFVRIMYSDGSGYALFSENMTKTGRHFPEIATILENMRGEQDG